MRKRSYLTLLCVFLISCNTAANPSSGDHEKNTRAPEIKKIKGFTDTPKVPGTKWHVHDPNRPQPEVVQPKYDGKPVEPPEGATVLFDGSGLEQWVNDKWNVENGYMEVTEGDNHTEKAFGAIHLHIEWQVPSSIKGWGQKRGNSGVFLMGRYEVQVLDGWRNRVYPDGMAAAIYGQKPPRVNASRPTGEWQRYDIYFHPPMFDGENVKKPAVITVKWNGVTVHDQYEIKGRTLYRKKPSYKPHPRRAPIMLQDHGNPVRYRNIWVKPLK